MQTYSRSCQTTGQNHDNHSKIVTILPRFSRINISGLANAIFTKFVIMPRTRQRVENVRRFLDLATRNQRAITLNRFQQKSHSVFDTIDRNQPVATCLVHESFRSSMTLDFLRQRSALTRTTSALRLLPFFLRPVACLPFLPSFSTVSVFSFRSLDTCTWAWPANNEEKYERGGLQRVGERRSFVGSIFLWVKNRVAVTRRDFRYHARATLIIGKLLR